MRPFLKKLCKIGFGKQVTEKNFRKLPKQVPPALIPSKRTSSSQGSLSCLLPRSKLWNRLSLYIILEQNPRMTPPKPSIGVTLPCFCNWSREWLISLQHHVIFCEQLTLYSHSSQLPRSQGLNTAFTIKQKRFSSIRLKCNLQANTKHLWSTYLNKVILPSNKTCSHSVSLCLLERINSISTAIRHKI